MAKQQSSTGGREIARKITIASVTGGAGSWFESLMAETTVSKNRGESDYVKPLMKVFGLANGGIAGATDLGEFFKLQGTFRAINSASGEITESPQVILPNFLGQALKAALDTPERAGPIQFAFEIGVRFDATSVTKYSYVIRDLMPPAVNDPLASLEKAILGLAAPSASAALPPAEPPAEPPAADPAPAPAPGKRHK